MADIDTTLGRHGRGGKFSADCDVTAFDEDRAVVRLPRMHNRLGRQLLYSAAALLLLIGCGDEDSSEPDAGASAADAMPSAPDAMAGAADAMAGAPDAAPAVVRFDEVHPIFAAKCGPCHSITSQGGHRIANVDIDIAYASSQQNAGGAGTVGAFSLVRIQNGSMPGFLPPPAEACSGDPATDSGNARCLTQAEQDLIQAWLDDGQLAPL